MRVDDPNQPGSPEAERATIGAMLIDPDCRYLVLGIVQPADFSLEKHEQIVQVIADLGETPSDYLVVQDELDRRGLLDGIGGPAYLTGLVNATPTSLHAEHYAHIVAERAVSRRLLHYGNEVMHRAVKDTADDALAFALKGLINVETRTKGGLVAVSDLAGLLYDRVEQWANHPLEYGQVRGLATGIGELDRLVGGLEPGWLMMVAGRPAMGKSSLCFDIARRAAMDGKQAALFSLEMPKLDVLARWASALSGVESRRVRRGVCPVRYMGSQYADYYVTQEELGRYVAAVVKVSALRNVWIDDSRALSTAEIRARAMRQAQRAGGLDLVVVDHTGRIKSVGNHGENTAKIEGRKSQELSDLAGELGCPIILAQQLNRECTGMPTMENLRDSGEHEQNAHVILGLYRESYYNDNLKGEYRFELQIKALKNREGPSGKAIKIRYEPNLSRFTEYTKESRQ